jgi:hypothetical protein
VADVRFSNRPFGVKHFQTIHHCSVDVAHGLALLFGIGALPSWDSRTRWNNLSVGFAARRTAGPSGQANSPHPSSREGHHSTARWNLSFLLSNLILHGFHAAAACSGPPELGAVNPHAVHDRQPRNGSGDGRASASGAGGGNNPGIDTDASRILRNFEANHAGVTAPPRRDPNSLSKLCKCSRRCHLLQELGTPCR